MTTPIEVRCLSCQERLDLSKTEGTCTVCGGKIEHHEARMWFPSHNAQAHMTCGEAQRTFYQPVHDDAGAEACYWTRADAEAAIAAYADDEEMKEGTWEIRERLMTPAAYFQAEGGAGVVTWHARTAVPRHEGNIALIANAPQDIADLLAEVKRLRQIEAAAKGARAGLHVALDGEVHRRSVEEALRMLDCYLSDDQAS